MQVKEKILDAVYKNMPYSQRPRAVDMDLGMETLKNKNTKNNAGGQCIVSRCKNLLTL